MVEISDSGGGYICFKQEYHGGGSGGSFVIKGERNPSRPTTFGSSQFTRLITLLIK
jgi:hypothetical protein